MKLPPQPMRANAAFLGCVGALLACCSSQQAPKAPDKGLPRLTALVALTDAGLPHFGSSQPGPATATGLFRMRMTFRDAEDLALPDLDHLRGSRRSRPSLALKDSWRLEVGDGQNVWQGVVVVDADLLGHGATRRSELWRVSYATSAAMWGLHDVSQPAGDLDFTPFQALTGLARAVVGTRLSFGAAEIHCSKPYEGCYGGVFIMNGECGSQERSSDPVISCDDDRACSLPATCRLVNDGTLLPYYSVKFLPLKLLAQQPPPVVRPYRDDDPPIPVERRGLPYDAERLFGYGGQGAAWDFGTMGRQPAGMGPVKDPIDFNDIFIADDSGQPWFATSIASWDGYESWAQAGVEPLVASPVTVVELTTRPQQPPTPGLLALAAHFRRGYLRVDRFDAAGARLPSALFQAAIERALVWAAMDASDQIGDLHVHIDWQGETPPVGRVLGARLVDLDDPARPTGHDLASFDTHLLIPCGNGAFDSTTSCAPSSCGAFGQLRGPEPVANDEACSVFPWGVCVAGQCETDRKRW